MYSGLAVYLRWSDYESIGEKAPGPTSRHNGDVAVVERSFCGIPSSTSSHGMSTHFDVRTPALEVQISGDEITGQPDVSLPRITECAAGLLSRKKKTEAYLRSLISVEQLITVIDFTQLRH